MQDFIEALTSESKSTALPDEFNYFGKLIGSWAINYICLLYTSPSPRD